MKILSKQITLIFILTVSISASQVQACEWYDVGCWTGGGSGGGGGGGGNVTDPLGAVEDLINGISDNVNDGFNDMNSGFNDIGNDFNNLGNDINNQFSAIESDFNQLTGSITGIYDDIISLANGVDPNLVANAIIYEFQNESNCQQLPARLDAISQYVLDQAGVQNLPIPADIKDKLNLINFSQLNIIGIDPATANSEDLYYYKITTVRPLKTLKGLTGSVYKIPFVIGSAVANACADATALRIGQRSSKATLDAQIHQELSRDHGVMNLRFQLPQSQGGVIENVEGLLQSVIQSYQDMGMNVPNKVRNKLADGQEYYSQGRYAKAFKAYKKAYKKLAENDSHDEDED